MVDLNAIHTDIQAALLRIRLALIASNALLKPEVSRQYDAWRDTGRPFQPETQALIDCAAELTSALANLQKADKALQVRQAVLEEQQYKEPHL